jgi:hypothetical protein
VTQRELLNLIEEKCHMVLTHGRITPFLARNSADIAEGIFSPPELSSLQTAQRNIDEYIGLIKAYILVVSSELAFNLDEVGLSDWEERRPRPVLVTADRGNQLLHDPVDRDIRHQALLRCVSASGDASCPLLPSASRDALSILDKGVRDKVNIQIKIVNSSDVRNTTFIDYLGRVLISTVASNCSTPGRQNKPAILFCDNCACQCSNDVKQELIKHDILLIEYPPHTSQIFQVLDSVLFRRLKATKKCLLRDLTLGRELDHMRNFRVYKLA